MTITASTLDRNGVIQYVGQHAAEHGLDPAAVLAVANHEGLSTKPGSSWVVPGESNISFGPPSWFGNGAGAALLARFGKDAPAWSWTPDGIDYWLNQVETSARGLTGVSAIRAIVTGFERPRANLVQGEITNATNDYAVFQQIIGGGAPQPAPGIQLPGQTQTPGQTQGQGQTTVPSTSNPEQGGQTPDTGLINPNFGPSLLHLLIQILLVIIGVALIMGGVLVLKDRVK